MPMIKALRNPHLKQRHWEHIEIILQQHFTNQMPLTLGLLEHINAMDYIDVIKEISQQARAEAALELLLKKVICLCFLIIIIVFHRFVLLPFMFLSVELDLG